MSPDPFAPMMTYEQHYGAPPEPDEPEPPSPPGRGGVVVNMSDVKAERVRWLWKGRIPFGKVTVLDGDPGQGKSTITLDLAARVSTGSPMPDGHRIDGAGAVVILSAEDGIADTIRPRLDAAGADPELVNVLAAVAYPDEDDTTSERDPVLPADVAVLEEVIAATGAVLVIIDPLAAYLSDRTDSYKDSDVRRALMPLAKLAERTGVAIVIVRHLTKSGGANPLYRGGGSIGIIGASRVGLLVAADPDDESRHVLAVSKSNLAAPPPALAYRLVPDELRDCAAIRWEGATGHHARDLLGEPTRADVEQSPALDAACSFLDEVLALEPRWVKEIRDDAKAAALSWRTVERAKDRKRVEAFKVGRPGDPEQGWKWRLPKTAKPVEDRQTPEYESAGQGEDGQDRHVYGGLGTFAGEVDWDDTPS